MLQILNRTRMKAALTLGLNQHGAEMLSVAVKGAFAIPGRGQGARLADDQIPPLATDVYTGEPGKSSLKYPADLVLGKPGTDVILIGTARSPGSRPVTRLEASVRVGPVSKQISVTGDRCWEEGPLGIGLHMTRPVKFQEMPLVYERAFGGMDRTHPDEKRHGGDMRNPAGLGFRLNKHAAAGAPLPNLEDPGHPMTSWKDRPPVAGFGPIDGAWEPRLRFAGTYDDNWQKSQAPLLPPDFDPRYFNVAPEGLVADGYLRGGESVDLVNVSERGRISFHLPGVGVDLALHLGGTSQLQKADLWTIILEPDEHRFCMVWGSSFSIGKHPARASYVEVNVEGSMKQELAGRDDA